MSKTKIPWATDVWNPWTGCSPVSEGCRNCYAKRMATRLKGRFGYPADEPFKVTFHPDRLEQPLHWKKPRRIFVCSMGDLFHKNIRADDIGKIFRVMKWAKQHTFIILTKRPKWAQHYYSIIYPEIAEYKHIWLGVSVEDQKTSDERIPILLQIPAAVRFVSYEPALGPVDFSKYLYCEGCGYTKKDMMLQWDHHLCRNPTGILDGIIAGCESSPHRRPANIEWFRSIRDQCQSAGISYFLKQMEVEFGNGKLGIEKMPFLDGQRYDQIPGKIVDR